MPLIVITGRPILGLGFPLTLPYSVPVLTRPYQDVCGIRSTSWCLSSDHSEDRYRRLSRIQSHIQGRDEVEGHIDPLGEYSLARFLSMKLNTMFRIVNINTCSYINKIIESGACTVRNYDQTRLPN